MKKLVLLSTLFCFSAFAANENSEFSLALLDNSASCSSQIKKQLDLGKAKVQAKRIQRKVENTKECAAQFAVNKLYLKCQDINKSSDIEFASSPTFKDEGCTTKFMKVKGQDYIGITCKVKAQAECLKLITN